jgi:hypothetical protein
MICFDHVKCLSLNHINKFKKTYEMHHYFIKYDFEMYIDNVHGCECTKCFKQLQWVF